MLPESTVLGELSIVEVYEYYIQPALFSCRNRAGQMYLAVWIDDNEDFSRWLYVALSPERFAEVRSGEVSLRRAFAEPEDEVALDVVIYADPELPSEVDAVPADRIKEAWLPSSGEYLELQTPLPKELRAEAFRSGRFQYSERSSRQRISFQVDVSGHHSPEPRHYTGSTKPLDRESYEELRRQLAESGERDLGISLVTYYQTNSEVALVA